MTKSSLERSCNVIVTPLFEYVIRESMCAGVRDRASGDWLQAHYAIGRFVSLVPSASRVRGASRWDVLVEAPFGQVQIGPVLAVERPTQDILGYLLQQQAMVTQASAHQAATSLPRQVFVRA